MEQNTLDRVIQVVIKEGELTGTAQVNLPDGTLLAVAKYHEDEAPGFMRMSITRNSTQIVRPRHHKAFDRAGGGRYIDQYKPLLIEAGGQMEVNLSTDTPAPAGGFKMDVEFVIVSKEQLPFYMGKNQ